MVPFIQHWHEVPEGHRLRSILYTRWVSHLWTLCPSKSCMNVGTARLQGISGHHFLSLSSLELNTLFHRHNNIVQIMGEVINQPQFFMISELTSLIVFLSFERGFQKETLPMGFKRHISGQNCSMPSKLREDKNV